MAQDETIGSHAEHPAPARHKVDISLLAFGLMGAPIIWGVHFLANVTIASRACASTAVTSPSASTHAALLAIDAVAALVALAALFVSIQAWRATRHEGADTRAQGTTPEHHAAEVGEGRTRFIALGGIMMSIVFFVAILFDTFAAIVVTTCGK
jgi:HAMP domain-containing protein